MSDYSSCDWSTGKYFKLPIKTFVVIHQLATNNNNNNFNNTHNWLNLTKQLDKSNLTTFQTRYFLIVPSFSAALDWLEPWELLSMSWWLIRIEGSPLPAKCIQSIIRLSHSHRCRGKLALEVGRQTLNRARWEAALLKSVRSRHPGGPTSPGQSARIRALVQKKRNVRRGREKLPALLTCLTPY